MRLVFAGTPEFAVPALDALLDAGHDIAAVYTQPDRPAGRGRVLQASPVAQRAAALKLSLRQAPKFTPDVVAALGELAVDAMVVVAYGLILPPAALAAPRHGGFNIHASLLPRWRGAAPIQRAILAGDEQTGVTIMRMEAGLDTGPVLLKEEVAIGARTAGELAAELSALGARLMVQALAQLSAGTLRETAQPAEGVTYAAKISKDEARIDWRRPAVEIARGVRAFNPAPVAWTELDGERVRIWRAAPAAAGAVAAAPGTIVGADAAGLRVATGEGVLAITELQLPGGRAMGTQQAVAGRSWAGRRLG